MKKIMKRKRKRGRSEGRRGRNERIYNCQCDGIIIILNQGKNEILQEWWKKEIRKIRT